MKNEKPTVEVCFTGFLIADKWSENGEVIGVAIYTDKEEIYLCARNELFEQLLQFIQSKVMVEGDLDRQPGGRHVVNVRKVRKLEEEIDDDPKMGLALDCKKRSFEK